MGIQRAVAQRTYMHHVSDLHRSYTCLLCNPGVDCSTRSRVPRRRSSLASCLAVCQMLRLPAWAKKRSGPPLDLAENQVSMVKHSRKTSRAARAEGTQGTGREPRDTRAGQKPDGRLCKLCHNADSSDDPLDGGFLYWAYPASQSGSTVGNCCWYCNRVFMTIYRHDPETNTLPQLTNVLGTSSRLN